MDKEKILTIAENFQDECHATVEAIRKEKSINYQDATTVWMFHKLATLQFEIDALKKNQRGKGVKGES